MLFPSTEKIPPFLVMPPKDWNLRGNPAPKSADFEIFLKYSSHDPKLPGSFTY